MVDYRPRSNADFHQGTAMFMDISYFNSQTGVHCYGLSAAQKHKESYAMKLKGIVLTLSGIV